MAVIKTKALGPDGFDTRTDLDITALAQYDHLAPSQTEARFYDDAHNDTTFSGKGFKYLFLEGRLYDVLGGTITTINVQQASVETIAISDVRLSAAKIFDFYVSGGVDKEIDYLLAGNDTITGTRVTDYLEGRRGNDTLNGGLGNDTLVGGQGNDVLTGGGGSDLFFFAGSAKKLGTDLISDYNRSQGDAIDLSFYDLSFIGDGTFSGDGAELRVAHKAGKTYIEADTDGNGVKDLTIVLKGTVTLSADDFFL